MNISLPHQDLYLLDEEFTDLVASFLKEPSYWKWKPEVLSPAQCARRGWRCVAKDMLECSSCHVNLCCHLTSGSIAYKECLKELVSQLTNKHQDCCPWALVQKPMRFVYLPKTSRSEAFSHLQDNFSSLLELDRTLPPVKFASHIDRIGESKLDSLLAQLQADNTEANLSRLRLALVGWVKEDSNHIKCHRCQRTLCLDIFASPSCEPEPSETNSSHQLPTSPTLPSQRAIKTEPIFYPASDIPALLEEPPLLETPPKSPKKSPVYEDVDIVPAEPISDAGPASESLPSGDNPTSVKPEPGTQNGGPPIEPPEKAPLPLPDTREGDFKLKLECCAEPECIEEPLPTFQFKKEEAFEKKELVSPNSPIEYSPVSSTDNAEMPGQQQAQASTNETEAAPTEEEERMRTQQQLLRTIRDFVDSISRINALARNGKLSDTSSEPEALEHDNTPPASCSSLPPRQPIKRSPSTTPLLPIVPKRRKISPKTTLDPLYEHRSWCGWVIANPELENNLPGWQFFLDALFPTPPSQCVQEEALNSKVSRALFNLEQWAPPPAAV